MGEVDDLEDPENQRKPDRHDRVDAAQHHAGDQQLRDRVHQGAALTTTYMMPVIPGRRSAAKASPESMNTDQES